MTSFGLPIYMKMLVTSVLGVCIFSIFEVKTHRKVVSDVLKACTLASLILMGVSVLLMVWS